jgi:hypothetical protein
MAGGGGGAYKKMIINFLVQKPHMAYVGGAASLAAIRWYSTQTTYNYWFGRIEFERRLERNQL